MRTALLLLLAGCAGAGPDLDDAEALARQASDDDFTVPMNDVVLDRYLSYTATETGQVFTAEALQSRSAYEALIAGALDRRGLPRELEAVVFVESGYRNIEAGPPAVSAAGLWQFIPQTGRTYGLRVDHEVDERYDPVASTDAALSLLSDLHARYGDWGLAFAAYNSGPNAVDAAIEKQGTTDVWELTRRDALPSYAANVMAAVIVLETSQGLDADQ